MSGVDSNRLAQSIRDAALRARSCAAEIAEPPSNLEELAKSLEEIADNVERTVTGLAEERARFQAVLEEMREGVIAIDGSRRVTLMNPAAASLLGASERAVNQPLAELSGATAFEELLGDSSSKEGGAAEFDHAGKRLLAEMTPPRATGGHVIVLHDVSAIRRLEAIRRDFVANVSHELRTPVSVVQANAETLLNGALTDEVHARPLLEALHRNSERMSRLITDLLDLSRLEAGHYEISQGIVPVRAAAGRALQVVERAAAAKDTAIAIDVPEELAVRADPEALDQVLVNYMENAIKYTPDGGHVRVSARPINGAVRIEVSDDGPGIPERLRDRVFQRFYRVDPGRSRHMGGTGLGLSIVKHLADAMHGRVGVTGAEPSGSVFWLELPTAS